eukprot:CAMPEP_0185784798 /NCGR_PEP_ID=MMETSP1174-20130828/125491_1 /TAXON_ID=35687 /ORGANISM="Dictyocha speculum, Strain CCMP1381" /LENGTH=78 /DNA_ID=CAMNT_0028476557 /DNA_START=105 /DNA_END=341 /DNA_ORIENTATION=+
MTMMALDGHLLTDGPEHAHVEARCDYSRRSFSTTSWPVMVGKHVEIGGLGENCAPWIYDDCLAPGLPLLIVPANLRCG